MFAIRNIKREAVLAQPERSSGSEEGIGRDEASITSAMAAYNDALNGGSTAAVTPLYTDDGVFMPPHSPSAVGKEAVRKAYDAVFRELKFNVNSRSRNWSSWPRLGPMCEPIPPGPPRMLRAEG
jgi:hypothetical protein